MTTVDQRPLFPVTGALARASDPDTSHQAAASIGKGVEHAIMCAFQTRWPDGFTDDELADYLPTLYPPTVKTARSRLAKHGLLKDSSTRRMSHRGREMCVWVVA